MTKKRNAPRGQTDAERLAHYSGAQDHKTGCIEWQAGTSPKGYGVICIPGGGTALAHRVAYSEATGNPIPPGIVVMHSCDNPPCVNPDHLAERTHADNVRDREAKGRGVWKPPSDEDVAKAKKLYATGMTQAQVAKRFSVDQKTICNWLRR